ncbi:uncharacterized protein L199_001693 [Kwoniella botswanensis]|uniref:uncharacterized protein n=1 Tax=Kwoniella botswanensis TaxID=1268659 RepID=UPI00315C5003
MSFQDLSLELIIHILNSCWDHEKYLDHEGAKLAAQDTWAACLRVNKTLYQITAPILYRDIIVSSPLTLFLGTTNPFKENTKLSLLRYTRGIQFRSQPQPQFQPHDRQLLDNLRNILNDKVEVTPHLEYIRFGSDSKVGYPQELKKLLNNVCKPKRSWCQTTNVDGPDTEIHIQHLPHNRDDDRKINIEGNNREGRWTDLSSEEADWPLLSISWGNINRYSLVNRFVSYEFLTGEISRSILISLNQRLKQIHQKENEAEIEYIDIQSQTGKGKGKEKETEKEEKNEEEEERDTIIEFHGFEKLFLAPQLPLLNQEPSEEENERLEKQVKKNMLRLEDKIKEHLEDHRKRYHSPWEYGVKLPKVKFFPASGNIPCDACGCK